MKYKEFTINGKIIDVFNRKIIRGEIHVMNGKIDRINKTGKQVDKFIIPGLVDAHIHIESSMLIPSEFARIAVRHGTVATISDPHEIANVLGKEGIRYMIRNGNKVPFKFYFGVPSCVPATNHETSGAKIDLNDIEELFIHDKLKYLSEVMNFPGVIKKDKEVIRKIDMAKEMGKNIDGHAPGLRGKDLETYIYSGITTDHECTDIDEAREKISKGMKILIREGSAAKNFDELIPLMKDHPDDLMLCSDDIHPDDLIKGHINLLIRKALREGYDLFDILRAASVVPVMHYNLDVGLLREGDRADFVVLTDLNNMIVKETYINGIPVFKDNKIMIDHIRDAKMNIVNCSPLNVKDILVRGKNNKIKVIEAFDGQLYTRKKVVRMDIQNGYIKTDPDKDILKIISYNRYRQSKPAVGFIRGFGLKKGAIASTVAHDSHNIIAVGRKDEEIIRAVNRLIEIKGGIIIFDGETYDEMHLKIAGLMSNEDGTYVAQLYQRLNEKVKVLGSQLKAPFMTLSFMALLVIPELKIGDKGLFDVTEFKPTSLFIDE
jgi:adenine deaminase